MERPGLVSQSMDAAEKRVAQFLAHLGYTKIVHEPDGKVPPDFLVDDRIAVEVRRLNQSHKVGTKNKGLEETRIPLWQKVKSLALSLGPPTQGVSWFVFFRFSRPVEWKKLKPKVRAALQNFKAAPITNGVRQKLTAGFELQIFKAALPRSTFYVMAGLSDDQSGGWLIDELEKNLRLYIDEKTKKVREYRAKYPEWWLVLVDFIAYGLDEFDIEQFQARVTVSHSWDRVIVIDPNNPARSFEV
jgi:hypothetical protein